MNSGSSSSDAVHATAPGGITVRVKFLVHFPALFGAKEKLVRLPPGSTLGQLLRSLGNTPARRRELLTGEELNAQVVVMKTGTPAQALNGLATELADGDAIAIFPFLAGG